MKYEAFRKMHGHMKGLLRLDGEKVETRFQSQPEIDGEAVLRWLDTVEAQITTGNPLVPQEEAERRAEICAGCPKNGRVKGCVWCKKMAVRLGQMLAGRYTRFDRFIDGCAICKCELKAAVHVDLAVQQAGIDRATNDEFPTHCWKKRLTA